LSEYVLKQKFKPTYAYILLKNRKNRRALGAPPPYPLVSGSWGMFAPDPQPPAAGGSTPRHPD